MRSAVVDRPPTGLAALVDDHTRQSAGHETQSAPTAEPVGHKTTTVNEQFVDFGEDQSRPSYAITA